MEPPTVLFLEAHLFDGPLKHAVPEWWSANCKSFENDREMHAWVRLNPQDVIFARLGLTFGRDFFEAAKGLQILASPTTGVTHIDENSAQLAKVQVVTLRGQDELLGQVTSTAEHAWTLLLALTRSLRVSSSRPLDGRWCRDGLEINQVSGKTLGVIGLGRLGRMVANYGSAFGMKVLGTDPLFGRGFPVDMEVTDLSTVLALSDVVILTASYEPGQDPILGEGELRQMKAGSTLINVSRGELIDEVALVDCLTDGKPARFGADVLTGDSCWGADEPIASSLISLAKTSSSVLLTPHVGGYAAEAIDVTRRWLIQAVDQILMTGRGEAVENYR